MHAITTATVRPFAESRNAEICHGRKHITLSSPRKSEKVRMPTGADRFDVRRFCTPQDPGVPILLDRSGNDLLKRDVLNSVVFPISIIEVPPFGGVHREPLFLHFASQEVPVGALLG